METNPLPNVPSITVLRHARIVHEQLKRSGKLFLAPIPIIEYAEVKDLLNQTNKLFIDVRETNEVAKTGKIPTSINIPMRFVKVDLHPSFDNNAFRVKHGCDKPQTDTKLVFYCQMGTRSQNVAKVAAALGYNNVLNYYGSWEDWVKREGLPNIVDNVETE